MTFRTLVLASLLVASAACSNRRELEAGGGVYVTRSPCPQVGIPAATGDVTLFNPIGQTDSAAIDVVATMTNLRATCSEGASQIISTASFAVVASRRDAGPARTVILPYFDVAMQGGVSVIAKRIGQVALTFPAGSQRGAATGQATVRIARASTILAPEVQRELTRRRKPGEVDAAIDPMSDPKIRSAVARATFEHLVGFQLTPDQLRYNATR